MPDQWIIDHEGNQILATDARASIVCHMSASLANPDVLRDARLIAAAPDLLALVVEALSDGCIYADWDERARALIAKATGETA